VLIVIFGAYYIVSFLMREPLGPPLALESPNITLEPPTSEPVEFVPADEEPVCGHTDPVLVLVLLTQRSPIEPSRRVLAIRLVKADFVNRKVASVFFPIELKLPVRGFEELGINEARLDEVYRNGMEMYADAPVAAATLIAQALYDNFDTLPNHYFILDLSRMAGMIDAVGGVDVQILSEYDGTAYGLPHYLPGETHMAGETALAFATAVDTGSRWTGLNRQTQVLRALRDKVLSPSILTQAPEFIEQFRGAVFTDLSVELGLDLACLAEETPAEGVLFSGVGADVVSTEFDGTLLPDVNAIKILLVDAFGGLSP
jgi:anionic cell wall polymer biosynthesis LytR-Cps2A-Psr (LCP) family protein